MRGIPKAAAVRLALSSECTPNFKWCTRVSPKTLRSAALDSLRRWRNDDRAGRGAMAVVIAGEWVENLARLEADLDRPVTVAVEAARTPWWH